MKIFVSIEELSEIANRILAIGSYNEAEQFIRHYGSLAVFQDISTLMQGEVQQ